MAFFLPSRTTPRAVEERPERPKSGPRAPPERSQSVPRRPKSAPRARQSPAVHEKPPRRCSCAQNYSFYHVSRHYLPCGFAITETAPEEAKILEIRV